MDDVELDPVDMSIIWVHYELSLMYPEIMERLHVETPRSKPWPELRTYRYLNPTVVIDVNLETGSVPEYAFICLGRDRNSNKITEYYVSEEYYVGDGSFSPKVGRFMFTTGDDGIKVSLYAEEPARVLTSSHHNIEHLYLQARENKEPGTLQSTYEW